MHIYPSYMLALRLLDDCCLSPRCTRQSSLRKPLSKELEGTEPWPPPAPGYEGGQGGITAYQLGHRVSAMPLHAPNSSGAITAVATALDHCGNVTITRALGAGLDAWVARYRALVWSTRREAAPVSGKNCGVVTSHETFEWVWR